MARLYRPTIPLEIKCRVALRQLGEMWPDKVIDAHRPNAAAGYMVGVVGLPGRSLGRLHVELLGRLAELLACSVEDLRLDHDPPLAARMKRTVGHPPKQIYSPDANDPAHLFYRPHGPQFDGSHLIKTNVRGDHGQHPDRVLIKKARRQERSRKGETPRKTSRFPKRPFQVKRATDSAVKLSRPKRKWAKRPFNRREK